MCVTKRGSRSLKVCLRALVTLMARQSLPALRWRVLVRTATFDTLLQLGLGVTNVTHQYLLVFWNRSFEAGQNFLFSFFALRESNMREEAERCLFFFFLNMWFRNEMNRASVSIETCLKMPSPSSSPMAFFHLRAMPCHVSCPCRRE